MQIKPWQGFIIVCLLIAFPIFGYLGNMPILLWDESRLAISALEMYESGNLLIPTYHGIPDFWSAKPPMMIWLQVLSMKTIGINEFAVRLPGATAAFATCLFLYWFFAQKYKNPFLGILVAVVLCTCAGFVRIHGGRTGDYDALLVMFVTMFAFYYYLYLEEDKHKYLYFAIIALTAGTLTKGIASVILLPAVLLYTVIQKKTGRVFRSYHFYIGMGIYLLFGIGYYVLREQYNPGYILNVYDNEIGGRFAYGKGHNRYDYIFYYYDFFIGKTFRDWYKILIIGIIAGLMTKDKFLKRVTIYSLMLGVFYFIVVSKSKAKAEWYDMTSYPFFCVVTAIGIFLAYNYLRKAVTQRYYLNAILSVVFPVIVFIQPVQNSIRETIDPSIKPWTGENINITLFLQNILYKKHEGDGLSIAYRDYRADVEWYLRVLEKQGRPIDTVNAKKLRPGQRVIAFLPPEKFYIENFYNFSVSDTFRTVTVYSINGKK